MLNRFLIKGKRLRYITLLAACLMSVSLLQGCQSPADRKAEKEEIQQFQSMRESLLESAAVEQAITEAFGAFTAEGVSASNIEDIQVDRDFSFRKFDPEMVYGASGKRSGEKYYWWADNFTLSITLDSGFDKCSDKVQYYYLDKLETAFQNYMDDYLHENYPEYMAYADSPLQLDDLYHTIVVCFSAYRTQVRTADNEYDIGSRISEGVYHKNGESVYVNLKGSSPSRQNTGQSQKSSQKKTSGSGTTVYSGSGDKGNRIHEDYNPDVDEFNEEDYDFYDPEDEDFDTEEYDADGWEPEW